MITTSDRFVIYDISGGAVAQYAFTFPYADEADMKAYAVTPAGVQQPLVNPTDFTISGQVWNRVADLSAYVTLVIYRETPMTQPQDFRNGDAFLGPLLTDALDRATMQLQESREEASRSVAVPLTDPAITEIPPVGTRANMVFTWDEDGNPSVEGGYARVSPALLPFVTAADITAAQKALGLLPSGASSPIPALSQAFIADPAAENIPVGTNRFGATDLQGLLDVAVGTMYEHVPTPGATKEVNGWTRILYSGSGGSITITNGASLEPGDILIIANTGAGDYDVTINGAAYELPSGCAEIWVYEPGVDSDAPWMSTILQPRRSDMSATPSDDELVTVEYVRRHLAFYLMREWEGGTPGIVLTVDPIVSCIDRAHSVFCYLGAPSNYVLVSTDGLAFTKYSTLPATGLWYGAAEGNGRIVAVAYGTDKGAYSDDGGQTWTEMTMPFDGSWQGVAYNDELGIFCAITSLGRSVATSPNGTTWTHHANALSRNTTWVSICSMGSRGFCVISASGYSNVGNAGTWSEGTLPLSSNWTAVAYDFEQGVLLAVRSTAPSECAKSSDGVTWIGYPTPDEGEWTSLVWAPQLGLFIAASGSMPNVGVTKDGSSWAIYDTLSEAHGMAWGPWCGRVSAVKNVGGNLARQRTVNRI